MKRRGIRNEKYFVVVIIMRKKEKERKIKKRKEKCDEEEMKLGMRKLHREGINLMEKREVENRNK